MPAITDNKHYPLAPPEIHAKIRKAFHSGLIAWFQDHRRELPWRTNRSPYAVVVSEFMLQQTQVATVIPYFERWMKQFPDWAALANASEQHILKAWEGLGYYRRARNLHALAKAIVEAHKGKLPSEAAALEKLPGIGPYTAGAVASIAFNKRQAVLDGNVERVLTRVFNLSWNVTQPAVKKNLWNLAEKLLPEEQCGRFNEALMELGALVCTPATPKCLLCPMSSVCRVPDPRSLPVKTKIPVTTEHTIYVVIEKDGKTLMLKPTADGRWKGFHRFPQYHPDQMTLGNHLGTVNFAITRYRVQAAVHHARLITPKPKDMLWINLNAFKDLPLPTPQRKILRLVQK